MGERAGGGLLAFLFDEVRSAIRDARQKVVEEGWFGRVTTPEPVVRGEFGHGNDRPSFEQLWSVREPADLTAHAPEDRELDR